MEEYQKEVQEASGSQAVRQLRHRIKDGTLTEILQDWKWILSLCRGHRWSIFLYTLCGIGTSAIGLASGVASKYLIDCIVAMDRQRLIPLAALMVLTAAISVAFRSFTAKFSARLNINIYNSIQETVFSSLMQAKWMEIRKFSTGDLMSRFGSDLNTVSGCAISWLPGVVIQSFTVLATLAVVLYYDPMMALIALASTPVLLFASRRLMRRQRSFHQQMRQVGSGMATFQSEAFRNMDTLKSFGVEEDTILKLHRWQRDYKEISLEYNDFSIRTNLWMTVMGTAVQYLAMAYCLWRLWSGEILFGTMVLFLQQRSNLSAAFSSLISNIPTILSGSVAAARIRELTELEKEPRQQTSGMPQGRCRVELTNVQAAYSDDGRVVLSDVDLTVPAGTTVALVGPSGEGKSTLMRLMLGLVSPERGQVSLVDENEHRFTMGADTRNSIAYVPQGNTVMLGTIATNLRLVNPNATEQDMIRALEDACAWEFVKELPGELHAVIGEGGKGLSEGQAQRIAIARALLRRAPVMLLDEITSALDHETEQKVLRNLMRRGVTCITATHRSSILSLCSRVYRVQAGGVVRLSDSDIKKLMDPDL